jgi:nucleoside-diphosphate-sugar epimerase
MAKILVIGCGTIGFELAKKLAGCGHHVTGLKRTPPADSLANVEFIRADIAVRSDVVRLEVDFDYIYFIVSADKRDEASYVSVYDTGLTNLIERFTEARPSARWIFVSSTSVYGQNQGEWVDEVSESAPTTGTARLIVKAEQRLKSVNPANVIVRFSGIYGAGREYLLRLAQQAPIIQKKPTYFTNRIHEQDCIGILTYLLEQSLMGVKLGSCYLASDDAPAPLWDVITWLASQMQCPPPLEKSQMASNGQNKRCCNDRIKSLGYRFIYPDYQAGYGELIYDLKQPNLSDG